MKLHIFIILFLFTQTLFAQEDTRSYNYIAGGTMSFSHQKSNYTNSVLGGILPGGTSGRRNTRFTVQPYIGKLMNEKWMLGVRLSYSASRYEGNFVNTSISKSGGISAGLFGRYTLNPTQKFNVYIQPSASYSHAYGRDSNSGGNLRKAKDNAFSADSNLGVLYAMNGKFNVNLRIGGLGFSVGHYKIKEDNISNYYSSFNANFRLSNLSFGLEFKF